MSEYHRIVVIETYLHSWFPRCSWGASPLHFSSRFVSKFLTFHSWTHNHWKNLTQQNWLVQIVMSKWAMVGHFLYQMTSKGSQLLGGGSHQPDNKKNDATKGTWTRWFKVTFSSPNWRSLNPLKGSLNHPKKVTLNHQVGHVYGQTLRSRRIWEPEIQKTARLWALSVRCCALQPLAVWQPCPQPTPDANLAPQRHKERTWIRSCVGQNC